MAPARVRRLSAVRGLVFLTVASFPFEARLPTLPPPDLTEPEADPASPASTDLVPQSGSPTSLRPESASRFQDPPDDADLAPGWWAFWLAPTGWGGPVGIVSALAGVLMVAIGFHRRSLPRARWAVGWGWPPPHSTWGTGTGGSLPTGCFGRDRLLGTGCLVRARGRRLFLAPRPGGYRRGGGVNGRERELSIPVNGHGKIAWAELRPGVPSRIFFAC